MKYGVYCDAVIAGDELPAGARELTHMPEGAVIHMLRRLPADRSRAAFALSDPRQLRQQREDAAMLNTAALGHGEPFAPALLQAMMQGRVRLVNQNHPRWEQLLHPIPEGKRTFRVNLLALGDVGSTLLTALVLLGGDTISSLGICDLDQNMAQRWEMEMGQIAWPGEYDRAPRVEVIQSDQLFEGDVFVFCASKAIPPVGQEGQDVRMAQYAANSAIVASFARQARRERFGGLFAVVSDPVDPLCRQALFTSNRDENGQWDGMGLLPEQIRGYGLGVMNARAAYYAKKDPAYAEFLTEGRAFGPHGADLVIANSTLRYQEEKSRALTRLAVESNLRTRQLGFKPYVAPAISSGAISLLLTMQGQWHYSSVCLGDVFMGCRNRQTIAGQQTECLTLPPPLFARIEQAYAKLKEIEPNG